VSYFNDAEIFARLIVAQIPKTNDSKWQLRKDQNILYAFDANQDNSRYVLQSPQRFSADARSCEEIPRRIQKLKKPKGFQGVKLKPPSVENLGRREPKGKGQSSFRKSRTSIGNIKELSLSNNADSAEVRKDDLYACDALLSLIKVIDEKYSQNLAVIEQMTREHYNLEASVKELERFVKDIS
jgi:hypothetical protein